MTTPSPVVLYNDLIAEILSFLPVKSLIRFKCVNDSWKTLISDPTFIKLHLKKSATRNPLLITLITYNTPVNPFEHDDHHHYYSVFPYPIRSLLDNPSFTVVDDPYYHVNHKGCLDIVGSCNGLILLVDKIFTVESRDYLLRVWNPSTRTMSEFFGYFRDFESFHGDFNFNFGFDNSTNTYKVVARYDQPRNNVKILCLSDNVWRDIENFPVVSLRLHSSHDDDDVYDADVYDAVYLTDTLNWLVIRDDFEYIIYDYKDIRVEQFVIVSLDLGTETYNLYMVPCGFDEVPPAEPTIGVLGGCLCFSYSYKETDFVIWQMTKFGDEDSWTQFLKISYQNLQVDYDYNDENTKYRFVLMPLFLSEDGDTLILSCSQELEAILYNWRDNKVQRTKITPSRTITDDITADYVCWANAKGYVESLVPTF